MNLRKLLSVAFAGAMLLGASAISQANTIFVSLINVTPAAAPFAGNFQWNYQAILKPQSQLRTGDFFTVYDFTGFLGFPVPSVVAGVGAPAAASWTASSLPVGPAAPGTLPVDTAIPNITWTYSGPNFPPDANFPGLTTSDIILGTFSAVSNLPIANKTLHNYTDQTTEYDTNQGVFRPLQGHIGTVDAPSAVPVPASAWAGLVLLAGCGIARRLKKATA